jgi:ankyrin repeat protein
MKARRPWHHRVDAGAGRGHLEIVKVLLKAGTDPNAAGGVAHVGFFTPLTIAMNRRNKNRLQVIDTLIAGGARLNPPAWFPQSPLEVAVIGNDIEMMRALLKRGSDVNWEDQLGNTALATAVTIGEPNVDVVRLLLKPGPDPNKPKLWAGDDCVSILQFLDEQQKIAPDSQGRNRAG